MHTNTTRATQNATLPRRNRQNPALYQHILSDLAVEADQLKTPVSPTTPTKIRDKNNTKCPIAPKIRDKNNTKCPIARIFASSTCENLSTNSRLQLGRFTTQERKGASCATPCAPLRQ